MLVGATIGVWVWFSPIGFELTHPPMEMKAIITNTTVFTTLLRIGSNFMVVYFWSIDNGRVLIMNIYQKQIYILLIGLVMKTIVKKFCNMIFIKTYFSGV